MLRLLSVEAPPQELHAAAELTLAAHRASVATLRAMEAAGRLRLGAPLGGRGGTRGSVPGEGSIRVHGAVARRGSGQTNKLVDLFKRMPASLQDVLRTLRAHESELRRMGVSHAAVFGSVARGQSAAASDIDVLVDLDQTRPMGVFEYARVKLYINELLAGASDVVNRRTLKPLLRDNILRDAIHAF